MKDLLRRELSAVRRSGGGGGGAVTIAIQRENIKKPWQTRYVVLRRRVGGDVGAVTRIAAGSKVIGTGKRAGRWSLSCDLTQVDDEGVERKLRSDPATEI
ncbi:hypothetical protein L6452_42222 [Arctium lappa]|uniref:Uncharacterized protein n=1 Tax=Arctium lappa TaxID=4217 RepID=A0ACB8XIF1_ARCLA|nr:hypothetical protein L6452_42222 [Arctium lappa]